MTTTLTAPASILALGDAPRAIDRLHFSIVPDPRRVRLVAADLSGAVEVRQHLDCPYTVRGTVIVHRHRPHLPLPRCEVIDGPCLSEASESTFLATFAALIHDDDLDAVAAAMVRLHDRAVAI